MATTTRAGPGAWITLTSESVSLSSFVNTAPSTSPLRIRSDTAAMLPSSSPAAFHAAESLCFIETWLWNSWMPLPPAATTLAICAVTSPALTVPLPRPLCHSSKAWL